MAKYCIVLETRAGKTESRPTMLVEDEDDKKYDSTVRAVQSAPQLQMLSWTC